MISRTETFALVYIIHTIQTFFWKWVVSPENNANMT